MMTEMLEWNSKGAEIGECNVEFKVDKDYLNSAIEYISFFGQVFCNETPSVETVKSIIEEDLDMDKEQVERILEKYDEEDCVLTFDNDSAHEIFYFIVDTEGKTLKGIESLAY